MYKKLLEKMRQMGCVLQPAPALENQLQQVQEQLSTLHLSLTDEYKEFLSITDGLSWAGIEFFASQVHSQESTYITDLFSQNKYFQALYPKKFTCTLLGRTDDEYYVYDSKSKTYQILDEFYQKKVKSFKHFEKMFNYIISEQIEIIENMVVFSSQNTNSQEKKEN